MTNEGKIPKLRLQFCAKVQVNTRIKVTSGGVQTLPFAIDQNHVFVLHYQSLVYT